MVLPHPLLWTHFLRMMHPELRARNVFFLRRTQYNRLFEAAGKFPVTVTYRELADIALHTRDHCSHKLQLSTLCGWDYDVACSRIWAEILNVILL